MPKALYGKAEAFDLLQYVREHKKSYKLSCKSDVSIGLKALLDFCILDAFRPSTSACCHQHQTDDLNNYE